MHRQYFDHIFWNNPRITLKSTKNHQITVLFEIRIHNGRRIVGAKQILDGLAYVQVLMYFTMYHTHVAVTGNC